MLRCLRPRRLLLPVLLVATGLACGPSSPPEGADADAVAVEVGGIGFDEANHAPVVLLEESGGGRVLPIWIGPFEAHSIASEMENLEAPRPNTHDLARSLLHELGARVLRATVTELRGSTYYAVLRVEDEAGVHDLDARPSDAIAVALRCKAPLFVDSALFEARATSTLDDDTDDERSDPDPAEPDPRAEDDELVL